MTSTPPPEDIVERIGQTVADIEQNAGDANPERAVVVLRDAADLIVQLRSENGRLREGLARIAAEEELLGVNESKLRALLSETGR